MKKILTLVLALALSVSVLSGCGSKPASDKTPEELAGLYSSAITENGGEMAGTIPPSPRPRRTTAPPWCWKTWA